MAKKKSKKVARKFSVPKTEEDQLLILLKYTERAITEQGSGIDEFFTQQAQKLRTEIERVRKVIS